ncbi:TetR/AcrR family transcriptional regulator [Kineococcus indalonis]|uniref:TetR/AcrR family transcriptional regulator n=1 Tax=Kineococcus indalonis TaxID=2696566 RepID=UPI0014131946|nr:TetR/AcrR family transcriptional regulator C-terminal domain-containing protein [Kineococcus indalonis]NAZ88715.1 TetR family transcriptional regulator [Kineococcus indalonis]
MAVAQRRPRGRPSEPVLSAERITGAAVRLVTSRGHGALTMAALARELGVAPSALYNHVATKQDVLRRVQDHVNREVDCSAFATLPWDRALTAWARSYREVYARHVPLVPVIAVTPVRGAPHTLAMYERVAAGLRAGGWPAHLVLDAVVAVESFVLGSALDTQAPPDIFEPGAEAADGSALAAAVRARAGADPALAAFELGLAALVEGLRAALRRATAAPTATATG